MSILVSTYPWSDVGDSFRGISGQVSKIPKSRSAWTPTTAAPRFVHTRDHLRGLVEVPVHDIEALSGDMKGRLLR